MSGSPTSGNRGPRARVSFNGGNAMKFLGRFSLAPVVMALGLAAIPATARAQELVQADVPFAFTAGSVDLPAGIYTMKIDWNDREMTVRDDETGKSYFVQILTNLEKNPRLEPSNAYIVFDKKGEEGRVLSQVWLEGMSGVQLTEVKGAHKPSTSLAARVTAASSGGR
jgi:hypothetical protein